MNLPKQGDLVTTDFDYRDSGVIREVLAIRPAQLCQSGFAVDLSGGAECPLCGHRPATPIRGINAGWCKPVQKP